MFLDAERQGQLIWNRETENHATKSLAFLFMKYIFMFVVSVIGSNIDWDVLQGQMARLYNKLSWFNGRK